MVPPHIRNALGGGKLVTARCQFGFGGRPARTNQVTHPTSCLGNRRAAGN
jgi:hypothetical protein